MLTIYGLEYYIDFDEAVNQCKVVYENKTDEESSPTTEINIFKYELIKMCIDRVLDEGESIDNNFAGLQSSNIPVSFNLAFNSLLKSNIILENYDE